MEEKNIDESYKEAVEKDKQSFKDSDKGEIPSADFSFFITTLGIQASVFLGIIPNPVNNQKEENLNQAKLIIDTLGILKEKTKGNLTKEEERLLDELLYELRIQYANKAKI